MKKSLSKRILAIFLAVLMLVTAIPLTSFAADNSLEALKSSIKNYTQKMDGTVYTNMQVAYEAYIAAKELTDAYEYGRLTDASKLDAAKQKLDGAVANMTKYNFRTADQLTYTYPKWDNADATDNAVSEQQSHNVIYAGDFSTNGDNSASGESEDQIKGDQCPENGADIFNNRVYYGETVLLYDGNRPQRQVTTTGGTTVMRNINPRFPVLASVYHNRHLGYSDGVRNKEVWLYTIAPSNGDPIQYDGFNSAAYNNTKLSKNYQVVLDRTTSADTRFWSGGLNNNSHYASNYNNDSNFISGECLRKGDHDGSSKNIHSDNNYTYFASTLEFFRDMPETEYVTTEYLGWIFFVEQTGYNGFFGLRKQWLSWGTTKPSRLSTNVVNYVPIEGLWKKIENSAPLTNVDKYDQSRTSMISYMSAIDSFTTLATSIDKPETYKGKVADAVKTIDTTMKSVTETVDATLKLKSDDSSYADLRAAIEQYKDTYNKGNSFGTYTDDTWSAFSKAFGLAEDHMNGLPNNHYNNEAADLAAKLLAAGKALKKAPGCDSDAYVTARGKLKEALKGEKLSADSLKNVADLINGKLVFWNVQDWTTVPASKQAELDEETKLLNQAVEELSDLADDTLYKLTTTGVETLNADSIDKQIVLEYLEEAAKLIDVEVEILGVKYHGYDYDGAARAIQTAITDNMYWYTVRCVDSEGGTFILDDEGVFQFTEEEDGSDIANVAEFHYNTKVTVENPNLYNDNSIGACDWMLSVKAENTDTQSTPKYIGNGETMDIIVRGDTTLYTSSAFDDMMPYSNRITFVNQDGEVIDIGYMYEGEEFDIAAQANIPKLAFKEVSGYEITEILPTWNASGDETIEDVAFEDGVISWIPYGCDIVIQVNYRIVPQKGVFHVKVVDAAYTTLLDGEYKYNDYIELTNATAKSYKKVVYNEAEAAYDTECYLADASDYSFYVCEDITIMADTAKAPEEISVNVMNKPVTTNGRTYFVGSFACVPEGCEVISAGVVLDRDNEYPTDLSLSKVDKTNGVYNMSTANIVEESNQFVVVATGDAVLADINYVAYVIYSDGSKVNKIAYSKIKSASVDYEQTL